MIRSAVSRRTHSKYIVSRCVSTWVLCCTMAKAAFDCHYANTPQEISILVWAYIPFTMHDRCMWWRQTAGTCCIVEERDICVCVRCIYREKRNHWIPFTNGTRALHFMNESLRYTRTHTHEMCHRSSTAAGRVYVLCLCLYGPSIYALLSPTMHH